jgi:hypothetical protein
VDRRPQEFRTFAATMSPSRDSNSRAEMDYKVNETTILSSYKPIYTNTSTVLSS